MDRLQDILTFDDYEEVFTPGAPVEKAGFFFGRERELDRLEKLLRRPGFHPVVIGNRGVGKTSLVQQAFVRSELPSIRVTCNSSMTFDGFARAALRRLGVDVAQTESEDETEKAAGGKGSVFGIGAEASAKRRAKLKRKQIGAEPIDPWRFFVELRELDRKVIIVLDEYDVVAADSVEFHRSIAEVVKTLADNRSECDSRLVIVGIAQSAGVLLGEHESIERSVKELYLWPLNEDAVDDFLSTAESRLGFQFKHTVKEAIISAAGGYPYFVHLVGLECLDVMHDRDPEARVVEEHDYKLAVRRAVQAAFRSELRKYREAVKSLKDEDVTVMRELSLLSRQKAITEQDLARRVLHTTPITPDEFGDILNKLRSRGLIFTTTSTKQVRFVDPLMAPFLRAAIFPALAPDPDLRQLSLFVDTSSTA